MAVGARTDPYLAFSFVVEIESLVVGGFSEVTGLQVEVEILDYREGGQNDYLHRVAGPARYPANIVLRRGLTDAVTFWAWQRDAVQGRVRRLNASILLRGVAGEPKWRWNFLQAYPARWTGPELRAGSDTVAIESLELAHRGLDYRTSGPTS